MVTSAIIKESWKVYFIMREKTLNPIRERVYKRTVTVLMDGVFGVFGSKVTAAVMM